MSQFIDISSIELYPYRLRSVAEDVCCYFCTKTAELAIEAKAWHFIFITWLFKNIETVYCLTICME